MVTIMNERQRDMEEKMAQVEGFVGWEYSRTTEWSSRHGTISFDRMLIDYSEGAYEVHNCTVCFQMLVTFFKRVLDEISAYVPKNKYVDRHFIQKIILKT